MAVLTLLLTFADHWTTYLCLRRPIAGWTITEANPIGEWLFQSAGLIPGLMIDSGITIAAVFFLLWTRRLPGTAKSVCFGVIASTTGVAVLNNLGALDAIGLSVLGLSA